MQLVDISFLAFLIVSTSHHIYKYTKTISDTTLLILAIAYFSVVTMHRPFTSMHPTAFNSRFTHFALGTFSDLAHLSLSIRELYRLKTLLSRFYMSSTCTTHFCSFSCLISSSF